MRADDLHDRALLEAFEKTTLPFDQWNHQAHIRVAYIYMKQHEFEKALSKMRSGIQAYNEAKNVPESSLRGYHESITQAWLRLVHHTMCQEGPGEHSRDFCSKQPHLLQKTLLRLFYTRAHLTSSQARREFVEPDLLPLPTF